MSKKKRKSSKIKAAELPVGTVVDFLGIQRRLVEHFMSDSGGCWVGEALNTNIKTINLPDIVIENDCEIVSYPSETEQEETKKRKQEENKESESRPSEKENVQSDEEKSKKSKKKKGSKKSTKSSTTKKKGTKGSKKKDEGSKEGGEQMQNTLF